MTSKKSSKKKKAVDKKQTSLTSTVKKPVRKTKTSDKKQTKVNKPVRSSRKKVNVRDEEQIRTETLTTLENFGKQLYAELSKNKYPEVDIPIRSLTNSIYDQKQRQFVIGDKTSLRSAKNPSQLESLVKLVWLADYVKNELVKNRITGTIRDVYYASMNEPETAFAKQPDSDKNIEDLEALIGTSRDDMNMQAKAKSKVFGNLILKYTKKDPDFFGKQIDATSIPKGTDIDQDINTAEIVKCKADKVIVVEKNAVFSRFVEDKIIKKHNAILIGLGGQPTRADRVFIKRMSDECNLPVYVFTDGDIYGLLIALVIQSGSSGLSHVKGLAVPDAKWCGIYPSEFEKWKLKTMEAKPGDLVKTKQMLEDPRFDKKSRYYKEVSILLKNKRKVELEGFTQHGPRYISEVYLDKKLKEAKNMKDF